MFWSFRIMVGLGFLMLAMYVVALWSSVKGNFMQKPWLLRWAFYMLPAPWIAIELGWFVAEYGRQPWTIYGVLPTHLSVSNISVTNVWLSLAGFVGFYSFLLAIEMYLMIKYAKLGPGSLGTGRYDGESKKSVHITNNQEVSHAV
jgi:cytochrome d ubiquinol oxidase subunit I